MAKLAEQIRSSTFPCYAGGQAADLWVEFSDPESPRLQARLSHGDFAGSRELVDTLEEAVLLFNDRRFVDMNAAASRLLGLTIDHDLPLRGEDLIAPESESELKARWQRLKHVQSLTGRAALKSRDGSTRNVFYQAWPRVVPEHHLVLVYTAPTR